MINEGNYLLKGAKDRKVERSKRNQPYALAYGSSNELYLMVNIE